MAKISDVSFASTASFAGISVSANGIHDFGNNRPFGIDGRLEIADGSLQATLYPTDTLTNLGLRSEVKILTLPTNSGEYWTQFEFKLPEDWSYDDFVFLGSWYATPDSGDPTKHVTMGFRLIDGCLAIIVPQSFVSVSNNGETMVRAAITPGRWYKVTCRVNLQQTATGFREVYLDNVPILRQTGIITTYDDVSGPYFKFGVYVANTSFSMLRIWFKNATAWSGNNSYQDVMGSVPLSPQRHIAF